MKIGHRPSNKRQVDKSHGHWISQHYTKPQRELHSRNKQSLSLDQMISKTYSLIEKSHCVYCHGLRTTKTWPNQVRITVGKTAGLVTANTLWYSIVSTPCAKYISTDVKSFSKEKFEFMCMSTEFISKFFIDEFDLWKKVKDTWKVEKPCMDYHRWIY